MENIDRWSEAGFDFNCLYSVTIASVKCEITCQCFGSVKQSRKYFILKSIPSPCTVYGWCQFNNIQFVFWNSSSNVDNGDNGMPIL